MLIFLEGGWGKGGWHLVMSHWLSEQSGRADPGETLLNLLGILLHLPVNEHCCWRYPCVPCHEASRQHLHLTLWPQRKMAAAVTDVFAGLGREPWETCTVRWLGYISSATTATTRVCLSVHLAYTENKKSAQLCQVRSKWQVHQRGKKKVNYPKKLQFFIFFFTQAWMAGWQQLQDDLIHSFPMTKACVWIKHKQSVSVACLMSLWWSRNSSKNAKEKIKICT